MSKPYSKLGNILYKAYVQAAEGKGHVRHGNEDNWENQTSMQIRRIISEPFLFQAVKKIVESQRLKEEPAINELLGAMNYCALEIQRRMEEL
jgi:hypothetical protein